MLPVSPQLAAILQTSVRAPRVYASLQIPAVSDSSLGTIDPQKLGSQIILDKITSLRLVNQLNIGADTLDLQLDNTIGNLTPFSSPSGGPGTAPNNVGRYFYPGALDNKIALYLGLANGSSESILPKGVYISENFGQSSLDGTNTVTVSALDEFSMFQGQVYAQFPPRLYGSQTSSYFNPNYALTNPSADLKTYVGDTGVWMQSSSDSKLWASDYVVVAVYNSNVAGGATAVPNSGATAYTINYATGTVTFATAQAPGSVISVDARPLAMSPEKALKHLFVDFGAFDPNFLKFDTTGVYLPVMEVARSRSITDVSQDIVLCTAPRGIRWRLYFDENGYLNFTEGALDGPPVKTFLDEKDILRIAPEFQSRTIQNVIRANARASNDQQLTAIAYDVTSISTFGQKPTYDIPTQMLATVAGMDPGSGIEFMNGLVNSGLFELSVPTIAVEMDVLPDYSLQVGDPVTVIEKKTGINNNFYITQISNEVVGPDPKQTLTLAQLRGTQDFMFGIQAAIGVAQPNNPLAVSTQSGLISDLSLQNGSGTVVKLVKNGAPVTDQMLNPVIFSWDGVSALNFSISLVAPPATGHTYIWRWMYMAEDVYVSGVGQAGGAMAGYSFIVPPYDVTNNIVSTRSKRFYWPLLRCSDWLTNDGVTGYTTSTTLTSSWTGGVGATNAPVYGNLRIGLTDTFGTQSSGFVGIQPYATGTPGATILGTASTMRYGVDFGPNSTTTAFYQVKRKVTPMYLGVLVANDSGAVQLKRIPFQLAI